MNKEEGICEGDFVTDKSDYVLIGVIIGRETLGKLNIPGIKVKHPDNKLVIGDQAKIVDVGDQVKLILQKKKGREE